MSGSKLDGMSAAEKLRAYDEIRPLLERIRAGDTTADDERALYDSFLHAVKLKEPLMRPTTDGDFAFEDTVPRMNELLQLLKDKRYHECIRVGQALALERLTARVTCHNLVGAAYFYLEQYSEALQQYAFMMYGKESRDIACSNVEEVRELLHIPASQRELVRAALGAGSIDASLIEAEQSGERSLVVMVLLVYAEHFFRANVPQLAIPSLVRVCKLDPDNVFAMMRLAIATAAAGNEEARALTAQLPPIALPEKVATAIAPFLAEIDAKCRDSFEHLLQHFPD